jgi:hypothetical protein
VHKWPCMEDSEVLDYSAKRDANYKVHDEYTMQYHTNNLDSESYRLPSSAS